MVEDVVALEYGRLRETIGNIPDTPDFRDDVFAYALNRISPKYVAQRTGEVVSNLSLQSDQERARISVILMEAFKVVEESPREE